MKDNLLTITEEISNRLHNLEASGQIEDFGLNWSVDMEGLTIEIKVVKGGVESRLSEVYDRKCENIALDVMIKIKNL